MLRETTLSELEEEIQTRSGLLHVPILGIPIEAVVVGIALWREHDERALTSPRVLLSKVGK
jgi:hypothetical protein